MPYSPPLKSLDFENFQSQENDGWFEDKTAPGAFQKHFTAVTQKPRRLIPENPSQICSPSVGAMAEAFIAADLEASRERKRPRDEMTSRHLKMLSEARDNALRLNSTRDDTFDVDSFLDGPNRINNEGDVGLTNFVMEDVLGEVGDFLADWSVESELEKAKERDLGKEIESNGMKRRRLFGIL
jgi:hypothetical protein